MDPLTGMESKRFPIVTDKYVSDMDFEVNGV